MDSTEFSSVDCQGRAMSTWIDGYCDRMTLVHRSSSVWEEYSSSDGLGSIWEFLERPIRVDDNRSFHRHATHKWVPVGEGYARGDGCYFNSPMGRERGALWGCHPLYSAGGGGYCLIHGRGADVS